MMLIINLIFCVSVFVIIGGLSIKEEESSTILRMMIIKKFQKDVNKLSLSKIIKRNLLIIQNKNYKLMEKCLTDKGVEKKDAYQIAKHPQVIMETEKGSVIVSNITSSSKVEGKLTTLVGTKQDGKPSYFVDKKLQILKDLSSIQLIGNVKENLNDMYNNSVKGSQMAVNIVKAVEKQTGEKVKNPYLESIKNLEKTITKEPVDKL